jgi:hypothetical protein
MLEATELELLRLACEALDRAEQARVMLADEGLTSRGRYGQVLTHPLIAVERIHVRRLRACSKQLNLPEAPAEIVSPLALRPLSPPVSPRASIVLERGDTGYPASSRRISRLCGSRRGVAGASVEAVLLDDGDHQGLAAEFLAAGVERPDRYPFAADRNVVIAGTGQVERLAAWAGEALR